MKKQLSRKLVFLISFLGLACIFALAMIIIEAIPDSTPVFAAIDDVAETNEDTSVTITVLTNDTDIDTTTLVILDYTQGSNGRVAKTTTGLRYIPNTNFHGIDTFTYTLQNSALQTAVATVTVTVKSVNDAPRILNDYFTTVANVPALINVLANDTDVDGDLLIISGFLSFPKNGIVEIVDGKVRYTPNEGFTGIDTFVYRAKDPSNASDTATVTVNVLPAED
jgi:hypothetical protein